MPKIEKGKTLSYLLLLLSWMQRQYLYQQEWCENATLATKHCSQLAEVLIVKCQPFYLPRDFTIVIVAFVCIAPSANAKANVNEPMGGAT